MSTLPQPGAFRALAIAVSLFAAAPAFADSRAVRTPEIDQARSLIAEAEFDRALQVINGALGEPHNTDLMLGTLYELQGTTYLYLGEEAKARESFERLFQAVPDFELASGTSPKLRRLFDQVKKDVAARRLKPVTVRHDAPRKVEPGYGIDLAATVIDAPEGARTRLYYRRAGTEGYNSSFFETYDGDLKRAQIPAYEVPAQSSAYGVEYYIEVADSSGRRLAGAGNSLEPLLLQVKAASGATPDAPAAIGQEESWYQKWWVWTIAGVVVAGAGAAIAYPLLSDDQGTLPVTVKVQQ